MYSGKQRGELHTRRAGRRPVFVLLALWLLAAAALACNVPGGASPTETPTPAEVAPPEADAPIGTDSPAEEPPDQEADQQSGEQAGEAPQGHTPRVRANALLNVRSSHDANCPIIGTLPEGTEVEVRAKSPDGNWWQIPYRATMGWISAVYTTPVNDVSEVPTLTGPPCPTAVPSATLTPLPPTSTPEPPTNTPAPPSPTSTTAGPGSPTPTGFIFVTLNPCIITSCTPTPTPFILFPVTFVSP